MSEFFTFLILVSFVPRIRGDLGNITEQRKIAPRQWAKNNISEAQGKTVITTAMTVDEEQFDDNELRERFMKNFKINEYLEKEKIRNETQEAMRLQRKSRDLVNRSLVTGSHQGLECLSCFANGTSKPNEDCYQGVSVHSTKCAEIEQCYTELHPLYIKRGCVLPGRLNRTFVCKCPLCNDKTSFESRHYEYKKISDWEFDNLSLQKPLVGIDIICKVCETKGSNLASDNICKIGKNADYMVCGHNQICFTTIDDETDNVLRGCISKPAYNSFHIICNSTNCNSESFYNPQSKVKRAHDYTFSYDALSRRTMLSENCSYQKYIDSFFVHVIIFTILFL